MPRVQCGGHGLRHGDTGTLNTPPSPAPQCQQPVLNITHHLSKHKSIVALSGESKLLQRKDIHNQPEKVPSEKAGRKH